MELGGVISLERIPWGVKKGYLGIHFFFFLLPAYFNFSLSYFSTIDDQSITQ